MREEREKAKEEKKLREAMEIDYGIKKEVVMKRALAFFMNELADLSDPKQNEIAIFLVDQFPEAYKSGKLIIKNP